MKEEVKRILALSYARELVRNEDGTWHARVVEFPGCMTEGDTQEEALTNLEDAMAGWIEVHLEDGDPIPHPIATDDFSGKFMVRIPKSLHRDLVRRADAEGVSLNQYVSTCLAQPQFYVERRSDGSYSATRSDASRATAIEPTQAGAIERARSIDPNAPIQVERVRNTNTGARDQWRKR
jgi:antitoxin HicB